MFITADAGDDRDRSGLPALEGAERQYIQELYLNHYPALRRAAWNLGFRGDVVEDWLQETFLVAIRRIDALKDHENPGAYLTQILRNVIGHQLRSMKYAAQVMEKLRVPEAAEEGEYRDETDPATLYRGLVSDEELNLLIRFYLEGWSQKALAGELGIDIEACSKRIQRAKAHLMAAMKQDGLL